MGGLLAGESVKEASIHPTKSTGLSVAIIKKNPYRVFENPLDALADIGQPGLLIGVGELITSIELLKLDPSEIDIDSGRSYLGRDLRDVLRHSDLVRSLLLFLKSIKFIYYLFL